MTNVIPATQPDTTVGAGGSYAPVRQATLTIATEVVGVTAHGYLAGDAVVFDSVVTTTGLNEGVVYYVIATDLLANSFKVSETLGGSAVNLATGDGTATVQLVGRAYSAPTEHESARDGSDVYDSTRTDAGAYADQYTPLYAVDLTDSGDLVELVGHPFADEDQVVFSDIVDTTGLTAGDVYFVVNADVNDFQVEATIGGGAEVLTTDGTADVHLYDQTETTGVISHTNSDTSTAGVYGLSGSNVANPAYAAPGDGVIDATQPVTTDGGGSPIQHADPAYRAPSGPVPVNIFETAHALDSSYSGHPERAVTLTDAGDLVGLTDHGFIAGNQVIFDDIVGTTGLSEGQRYYVRTAGLTTNAFTVSSSGAGGSIVTLTTNGTGTVQRASTSTDVAGNADMTQVGAVADASAPTYGVPVAPTVVTATALDNGEVRVAWTAPAQVTGAPRIGYYVESSLGMSLYVAGNATSVDIQAWRIEADNQQDQTFTVRAVNKNGSGPKSTASAAVDVVNINQGYGTDDFPGTDINPVYRVDGTVWPGTGGAPGVPTAVTGDPAGVDEGATIDWVAPVYGTPTGYRVNIYDGATLFYTEDVGLVLTLVVTGLVDGDAYTARVIALDNVEDSAESVASAPFTALAVPGAPVATPTVGDGTVSVAYTTPTGAPTGYEVFIAESATPLVGVLGSPIADAASPLVINGLSNGTEYVVQVRAENASGFGAYGALSAPFTALAVPTAPTAVAGTNGNTESSISWTPGVGGGAAASFLVIVATAADPNTPVAGTPTSDPASPLVVTGLTNGIEYVARVAGVNASGTGPYSANSAGFTPAP